MSALQDEYMQEISEELQGNSPELKFLRIIEDTDVPGRGKSTKFWTQISKQIKQNRTLEELDIVRAGELQNKLTATAAMALSRAFSAHPTLKSVRFIGVDFAKFQPFQRAFKKNPRLSHLIMSYCTLTPSLMESVASLVVMNVLETLSFELSGPEHQLDLSGSLARNQSLKKLSITVDDLLNQSEMLVSPRLLQDAARMLERNQGLEELHLDLSNHDVTPDTLSLLAQAATNHKSLKVFYLSMFRGVHQRNAQAVGDMLLTASNLQELHLQGCGDTQSEGSSVLAQACRGIQSATCTLKRLTLYDNGINGSGAALLSAALLENESIQEVRLCHNPIGDEGATHLARLLPKKKTIIDLNLCGNDIGPHGVKAIADALATPNCSLKRLNLNLNQFQDDGAIDLANALAVNANLELLTLTYITGDSFGHFVRKLPRMSLKTLQIEVHPNWPRQYADHFLKHLEQNTSLEDIHLKLGEQNVHFREIMPQVKRILKLNKAGRRILSSNSIVPRSLWPRILAKSSSDADTIYYFLQQNPALFMNQQQPQGNVVLGKRKRDYETAP